MTTARQPVRSATVRHGEVRWPASIAIVLAATSYLFLPNPLHLQPGWILPSIEGVLLISLIFINPHRLTEETRFSRIASLTLVTVIIVANSISLVLLLRDLTAVVAVTGRQLLLSALQVWGTNMIAFALVYWELDRGGAVARLPTSHKVEQRADFVFPQDDARVAKMELRPQDERWMPVFLDYLYLSITNSTAFSPTDTMPLTLRAKALMAVEAMAALVTSLLVIARAVNILN